MKKYFLILFAISFYFLSCKPKENLPNTLSSNEKEEGWQLMFDGNTTKGWHLYNKGTVPSAWIVKEGVLHCKSDTFEVEHGDLVSDEVYTNFDLQFDWNISKAGNSGVFINVQEAQENPTTWTTGPEYQLLDNPNMPQEYLKDSTHWAACLYGFKKIIAKVSPNPTGEWNHSRIKQENGKIEFWLNGVLTAEEDLKSKNWSQLIAKSYFKNFATFGTSTSGRIALQDWSKGISFRNIKIRKIDKL